MEVEQYVTVGEDPEDGQNLWAPYEKRYHVFRFEVIQKGEVLSGTSDHTTNNARAEYQSGDICRLRGECER